VLAQGSAWVMFPLLGASAVGRLPFPVDISADQLLHGDSSRRHTRALSFASPAKFARSHAALLHVTHRSVCRFQAPLLGFTQRSPLHRAPRVSSPGCPGPGVCQLQTWSVLVVLPDFDGLLHTRPCGFVAPRFRPWGSPGFQPTDNVTAEQLTFLQVLTPFEAFPFPVVDSLSPGPAPLAVGSTVTEVSVSPRPQGFAPPGSPLLTCSVATSCSLDAPLGLSTISGSHRTVPESLLTRPAPRRSVVLLVSPKWGVRRGGLPAPSSCEKDCDRLDDDRVSTLMRQASRQRKR
jgi:hypothetical protein